MTGHWITRDGRYAHVDRRGHISSNVIVGQLEGATCTWRADGKYRWDDKDDERDLIESFDTLREFAEVAARRTLNIHIKFRPA